MENIFYLGLLILAGLFGAKLLKHFFKLPNVTGYLIAGIVIGPSAAKLIPEADIGNLTMLSTLALAFIAYNIGSEMDLKSLKDLGAGIFVIAVLQALGAFVLVLAVIPILGYSFEFALVLAAVATATAPAATLLVIQQYHAKGDLVDVLIPVVALDDAICIIVFGICSSIAGSSMNGENLSINNMLLMPLIEIFGAVALGITAGIISVSVQRIFTNIADNKIFIIGVIFLLTFASGTWGLSSLLVLMCYGFIMGNFGKRRNIARDAVSGLTPVVYVAFFALSGAELNLASLKTAGLLGVAYFILRAVGKYAGAFLGAKIAKKPKNIQKYLGLTLMPQAGVAIGLSLLATDILPAPYGSMTKTVVLASVILNEVSGPVVAKYGLIKSGDIKGKYVSKRKAIKDNNGKAAS